MIRRAHHGVRCVEADGREFALVENPWGVSVYHGRGDVTLYALSWSSARAAALFILRRYLAHRWRLFWTAVLTVRRPKPW